MRIARPALAIASPVITIALVFWLLTTAFSSLAQSGAGISPAPGYYGGQALALAPGIPAEPADLNAPTRTSILVATTPSLATAPSLSEFYNLVELAGLRTRLRRPTEALTVFAPTNEAMRTMAAPIRERLHRVGKPMINSLVRTHVVTGILTPDMLTTGREIETLDGRKLRVVRQADGTVLLDGIYRLLDSGQRTTNGIIYTIDAVIAPN
ncbi:MAG: fasciclin domain-containing protein [Hymenobacteraceae bacterium]|nr:fasciclin domain-containing protein [Hymenobacteraceae bacterium]